MRFIKKNKLFLSGHRQDAQMPEHLMDEKAKEALHLSEAKYKAMIENISDVILVIDAEESITYVSPNIERLFGWRSTALLGASCRTLIEPIDVQKTSGLFKPKGKSGKFEVMECKCRHKNGTVSYVELTAVDLIHIVHISGILINFHDISERKKREEEILYLSYHDALTGLYNRAFFDEELKRLCMGRQLPLSIIMGDVDGLKETNDTYGHDAGDKLLIEIASIFKTSCRREDIVARIGGDEFCVLLPNTGRASVQMVCDRIYSACEAYGRNQPWNMGISLGYATKTAAEESVRDVFKEAEGLMYHQKRQKTCKRYPSSARC